MNVFKSYLLWYDGAGMHEILGLNKANLDGRAATRTDRRAFAEYVLNKIGYANDIGTSGAIGFQYGTLGYNKLTQQPTRHIHRNCKQEIESKWRKPMLTDEETSEMIIADMAYDALRDIPRAIDVEMTV